MGFDPKNPQDIARLRQAATYSQKEWRYFLDRRVEAIKEMAGSNYGEQQAVHDEMLYPMLGLYVKTVSRLISSDNPRCHFTHWDPEASAYCKDLEIMVNDEFERIELGDSLREVVTASMFGLGVCKVGRVLEGHTEEEQGVLHQAGGLFVDPVLDEHFLFDMRAKRWPGVMFMGDESRVSLEWARDNTRFIKKNREKLQASNRAKDLALAGSMRDIRSRLLPSSRSAPKEDEYEDMVDLWNLWLPREKLMLVIDREFNNVLSVDEWEGPEHGPYHILGYNFMPGNLVPLTPVAELMDLHRSTNIIVNKVGEQIANMKVIYAVQGPTGEKDGAAVRDAPNRGVVQVGDINSIKAIQVNPPDQSLIALANTMLDKFSYFSGNIEALAGLGPQSPTAGQDRLLNASANRQVTDMGADVLDFTTGVMGDIAWYIKNDPDWSRQLVKDVPYADMKLPFVGRTADLPGEIMDYKLRPEPYSAKSKSPAERLATLKSNVLELVLPLMPMLREQGQTMSMEKLLKKVAELSDSPELANILVYLQGEMEKPAGDGQDSPSKPPMTTRKYVRENASTKTRSGQANAAQAAVPQAAGEMMTIG